MVCLVFPTPTHQQQQQQHIFDTTSKSSLAKMINKWRNESFWLVQAFPAYKYLHNVRANIYTIMRLIEKKNGYVYETKIYLEKKYTHKYNQSEHENSSTSKYWISNRISVKYFNDLPKFSLKANYNTNYAKLNHTKTALYQTDALTTFVSLFLVLNFIVILFFTKSHTNGRYIKSCTNLFTVQKVILEWRIQKWYLLFANIDANVV